MNLMWVTFVNLLLFKRIKIEMLQIYIATNRISSSTRSETFWEQQFCCSITWTSIQERFHKHKTGRGHSFCRRVFPPPSSVVPKLMGCNPPGKQEDGHSRSGVAIKLLKWWHCTFKSNQTVHELWGRLTASSMASSQCLQKLLSPTASNPLLVCNCDCAGGVNPP